MTGETIGLGVLVWLGQFVIIAVLSYFGLYDFLLVEFAAALAAGYVGYRVAVKYMVHDFLTTAVWLGISWALIVSALNLGLTRHFISPAVSSFGVWFGVLLITFSPAIHYFVDLRQKKQK